MKTKTPVAILASSLLLFLTACSNGSSEQIAAESYATTDTVAAGPENPASVQRNAVPELNGPDRKLIRTASMHAEVGNLYEATSRIESATLRLGGQVTNSSMRKELRETRDERSGGDSLTTFRRYQGVAQLSLRVPVASLDSLLRFIAAQTSFIDTRQVHIDDATFRYMANELRNKRLSGSEPVVAGVSKSDGLEARQYLDQLKTQSVDRQVENLQTADAVAFASLSIDLTQPEELVRDMRPDLARAMQPGAGHRLLLSLRNGWEILYDMILGLLGIWPLLILLGIGIVIARRWYRRQQRPGMLNLKS